MTLADKKALLIKMGIREETAERYLQKESDVWAVLPAFRFLKPLSDNLEFYTGGYKQMIEQCKNDGELEEKLPEVAEIVKAGVSLDTLQKFAYRLVLEAYDSLLYQLDDHEGAEVGDVFLDNSFSQCGYGRLMEVGEDNKPTGRYLIEVHGKIPFSDLT